MRARELPDFVRMRHSLASGIVVREQFELLDLVIGNWGSDTATKSCFSIRGNRENEIASCQGLRH